MHHVRVGFVFSFMFATCHFIGSKRWIAKHINVVFFNFLFSVTYTSVLYILPFPKVAYTYIIYDKRFELI